MRDFDLAVDLVTRAGALAAAMRAEGLDAEQKTSISDVVTAADHAAEALVTESLQRERPDDGLLGEEGTQHDGSTGRRWVIDPVDGTYNFFSGLAYWCSALALQEGDDLLLGAVHQPVTGETWLGGPDHLTTLNGVPVNALVDRPLSECSLATYVHPTTLHDPDIRDVWLAIVSASATPRVLGSGSCDLAGVAGGRVGVWAQHSAPDWDWLPGQALVRAAGGYAETVEHRGHTWHIAGNQQAAGELLERLTSA